MKFLYWLFLVLYWSLFSQILLCSSNTLIRYLFSWFKILFISTVQDPPAVTLWQWKEAISQEPCIPWSEEVRCPGQCLSWLECPPITGSSLFQVQIRAHAHVTGLIPGWGTSRWQPIHWSFWLLFLSHTDVSLSLPPSLSGMRIKKPLKKKVH